MLQDLVHHKWYANAQLLAVIRQTPPAVQDRPLRELMHHILLANRFWLRLSQGLSFVLEAESRTPDSLDGLVAQYQETHAEETNWLGQMKDSELERQLQTPYIPGRSFSVEQGIMQICLHSHGHRAQAAMRLRQLGGTPPGLDFVMWLKDRPPVEWPPC
jgi:uncharacterized damage-inducible protein DinB